MFITPDSFRQAMAARSLMGQGKPTGKLIFLDKAENNTIPISSCHINRDPAAVAQRATIQFPNVNPANTFDRGYYSPDRGDDFPQKQNDWHQVIMPGANIQVQMGYGSNLVPVFTGQIDDVIMSPDDSIMEIDCRDLGCLLIDQQVDDGTEEFYLSYEGMDASYIVKDLLLKAGIPESKIVRLQESRIIVDFIEFNSMCYADAIGKLEDMTVFELIFTEDGNVVWQEPRDGQPLAAAAITMSGYDELQLDYYPISKESEKVWSGSTKYTRDVDYSIDWETGKIHRLVGSTIPDVTVVMISFVYAAMVFREGVNLIKMPYKISRRDIYGKVIINGDGVQSVKTLYKPESYGVTIQKIITTNNESITTQEKADEIANRYIKYMQRKHREINFESIGVPWIQIGDCIQVKESTTTSSEIYRIVGLNLNLSPEGFTLSGTCYHYGYTG
jgi:hypothetical protein